MKNLIKTVGIILIIKISSITFCFSQNQDKINQFVLDPYNTEYVENEILIKFKDEVNLKTSRLKDGTFKTGQDWFDKWLQKIEAKEMDKVFPNTKKLKSKKMFRDWKGQMREAPQLFNIYRITYKSTNDAKTLAEELNKKENIEYAEPNYIVYIQGYSENNTSQTGKNSPLNKFKSLNTNDPLLSSQSYLNIIQIPQVWDTITGDTTQIIAILDTGVDWLHPDLDDNIWRNWNEIPDNHIDDDNNGKIDDIRGWDFINNDNNPMDDNSHGTHVAGIAAAEGNNGIGIAGINWKAKILPIKVFKSDGRGDAATISLGINYAAENKATVLNMSFGSYGRSFTMENALINAYINADLVASAGNLSLSIYPVDPMNPTTHYPAALSYVLGVEANQSFSNYDPDGPILSTYLENFNYELKAPGSAFSTIPNGSYKSMSGTSMSAPMVSGAISLYRTKYPNASKEKLWGDFIHTSSGIIKVYDAFYPGEMQPELDLKSYAVEDTIAGNDQDGQADAGELIQIYTTIRNTWGHADSVYAILSHSIYGNPNDVHIEKDSVFFGSMSTYGSLTNTDNPFLVRIDTNCFNNSNVTMNLTMKSIGDSITKTQPLDFTIYNGEELSGILLRDTTFTPDKRWIITNSLRISSGVTLTILPGTHLEIHAGIDNRGTIHAVGTADSVIYVKGGGFNGNGTYKYIDFNLMQEKLSVNGIIENSSIYNGWYIKANKIKHCEIKDLDTSREEFWGGDLIESDSIISCIIQNNVSRGGFSSGFLSKCLIDNNIIAGSISGDNCGLKHCVINDISNIYVYLYPNFPNLWEDKTLIYSKNIIIKNSFLKNNTNTYFIGTNGNEDYFDLPLQYWGTSDPVKVKKKYYDFMDEATLPFLNVNPMLIPPSDSCMGHVWKVLVNGKDAQDEVVEPVGVGMQKFEVYFNRAMDTTIKPLLSFGVRTPYLQNIVAQNTKWSEDKKVWTAYFDVNLFTGDGIQQIRVADAQDFEGYTIPVEDDRFSFVIQAAGVQSANFIATPGIGKVNLEWNNTGLEDFLGFNMYRYMSITDSTFTQPSIINESLITDTIYTDYSLIPDSTYHYFYKIVNTDLNESDSSNIISAVPFDAANGDSNGDQAVDVLDLTTIVSHILGNNPKPFLSDAADVNYDGQINVLDIISIVQLILGTKAEDLNKDNPVYPPATIYLNDSIIQLESEHQVGALQFKLSGKNLADVKLFSTIKGFEFSYGVVNDTLIGILYSFNGNIVPEGLQDIIRIEGSDKNLQWEDVFGSDNKGNFVPVMIGNIEADEEEMNGETDLIRAYPNPFSNNVTLKYKVDEEAHISIEIFNLQGQKIESFVDAVHSPGHYEIEWGSSNHSNNITPGIYICRIIINPKNGGNPQTDEIKLIKAN